MKKKEERVIPGRFATKRKSGLEKKWARKGASKNRVYQPAEGRGGGKEKKRSGGGEQGKLGLTSLKKQDSGTPGLEKKTRGVGGSVKSGEDPLGC